MENNIGNASNSSFVPTGSSVNGGAPTMAPSSGIIYNITTMGDKEPNRVVEFNPALVAVIVAMVISFCIVGFSTGFLKRCIQPDHDDAIVHERRRSQAQRSSTLKPESGLDPEIIESLPFILYKDLLADERRPKYSNCPVCLAAFDNNDCLRLLPECSHVFHSDCIEIWFRSHSTCPLCRAHPVHPTDSCTSPGVVEVVIGGNVEHDSNGSTAIPRVCQDQTRGTPMMNSSSIEEERERVYARSMLLNNVEGTFKPAVRVVVAHEKAVALVSIRRSNSTGTELHWLHPSYVVDSEGTQHNRNYQTHAINIEEFLLKDRHGHQA